MFTHSRESRIYRWQPTKLKSFHEEMYREYKQSYSSSNFGQKRQEQYSTPETKISGTNLAIKITVNKIFAKMTFSYPSRNEHEVYRYINIYTPVCFDKWCLTTE